MEVFIEESASSRYERTHKYCYCLFTGIWLSLLAQWIASLKFWWKSGLTARLRSFILFSTSPCGAFAIIYSPRLSGLNIHKLAHSSKLSSVEMATCRLIRVGFPNIISLCEIHASSCHKRAVPHTERNQVVVTLRERTGQVRQSLGHASIFAPLKLLTWLQGTILRVLVSCNGDGLRTIRLS